MKPAAGIYCRISLEDQSEFSLPSQEKACRELAASKGFQTPREFVFVDNGGLSTELDRPALARLLECARSGLVGMVVIHDIDRLARKVWHQGYLIEELEKYGTKVEFVMTPSDNTPNGRAFLSMKGWFSEMERERIKERTIRGSRERARQGRVNCKPPFGYVANPDGSVSVDSARAEIVKKIFSLMVKDGLPSSQVAVRLNADGVAAPKRSGGWNRAGVLCIVKREVYVSGELFWNQSTAAEPAKRRKPPKPGRDKRTSSKPRPQTEWFRLSVPVLIDRAVFDACQQAIAKNRKVKVGRPSPSTRFLLSGLTRCSACGSAVCGSSSGNRWLYYSCSARRDHRACTTRGGVRAAPLEAQVWSLLCDSLADPKTTLALYNRYLASQTKPDQERERKTLAASLEKLGRSEFNCRRALVDADLADSYESFRNSLKTLQAQRRDLERRLNALQPVAALADRAGFTDLCDRLAHHLPKLVDREQKKAFLQRIVGEIRLGETLEIDLLLDPGNDPNASTSRNCQPGQRSALLRAKI